MKNLAITLIEANNSEAPNIGTINYTKDDVDFMDRIKQALMQHFDAEEFISFNVQDGLSVFDVQHCPPLDATVVLLVNGETLEYDIEIQETWIY